MPKTSCSFSGDGVAAPMVQVSVALPDTGSSISIDGQVTAVGGTPVAITGSPLTSPTPPGSGNIYWMIQVNSATGAATIKQSTSAMPTADAGNIQVFSDTMTPTDTNLAQDTATATPDTW